MNFLDNTGLSHLWDKTKNLLSSKAEIYIGDTEPTDEDVNIWVNDSVIKVKYNGKWNYVYTDDYAIITVTNSKDASTEYSVAVVYKNVEVYRLHYNDKLIIHETGTYTFVLYSSDSDNQIIKEKVVNISELNTSYEIDMGYSPNLVSFSTATDEEITNMINAFYNDEITIDDIKSVWSVGDTRDIYIDAISSNTYASESHHADTYSFVILDFEHDDLAEEINGHTKALITIQMTEAFHSAGCTYLNSDSEIGAIRNSYSWANCYRRTWCNTTFKAALPTYIQNLNKQVVKSTYNYSSSSVGTTNDYAFFLSEAEIFGSTIFSVSGEGNKYSYFATTSRLYRPPQWQNSTGQVNSSCYWTRSPYSQSSTYTYYYVFVNWGQAPYYYYYTNKLGIVVALCL